MPSFWTPSSLLKVDTPRGKVKIVSAAEWFRKQERIRRSLLRVIGHPPCEAPPLCPRTLTEEDLGFCLRRLVSYSVEPGERVKAFLFLPKAATSPRPAVLCLHQTIAEGKREPAGLAGSPELAYALHLAQRGFVTLAPDSVVAGERMTKGYDPFDTQPFYQRHPDWSAVGKMVWDAQRGLDYLSSLPTVDPRRLGCIGHSLGGHSAIFTAALDERVVATVSSCGWQPFAVDENPLRWARDHWFIYFPRLRPYFLKGKPAPFEIHEVISLIAPRAFFDCSARNDAGFRNTWAVAPALEEVRRVYALLGAEGKLGYYLHSGGHRFPPRARRRAYGFLSRCLAGP